MNPCHGQPTKLQKMNVYVKDANICMAETYTNNKLLGGKQEQQSTQERRARDRDQRFKPCAPTLRRRLSDDYQETGFKKM